MRNEPTPMIEVVRTPAQLASLAPQWNELSQSCGVEATFSAFPFIMANWELWSTDRRSRLHIVLVRQGERLVGLAPMVWQRNVLGLGTLRWLDSRTSLYSSLLCRPEAEPAVFNSLAAHLHTLLGLRKLQADLVPQQSRLARFFESLHAKAVATSPAFRLELSTNAAGAMLSPQRRRELARCQRRLAELGTVSHHMVTDADAQADIASWIFERKREKLIGKNPTNHWLFQRETENYYRSMASTLAGNGGTLCSSLMIDNRRIAAGLYFINGENAFISKMAYDPAFGQWSPGWIDFLATSEKLAELKVKQVDLMIGQGFFKEKLASERYDVVTYRRRFNPAKALWMPARR